jgi:hypothetical protein
MTNEGLKQVFDLVVMDSISRVANLRHEEACRAQFALVCFQVVSTRHYIFKLHIKHFIPVVRNIGSRDDHLSTRFVELNAVSQNVENNKLVNFPVRSLVLWEAADLLDLNVDALLISQ